MSQPKCTSTYSIFTSEGQFITKFGETGSGDGQLSDPEGVGVDKDSRAVYVAELGIIDRIQLFEHRQQNCSFTSFYFYISKP
jgi:DNA-binding beta-propeller fold protein YncE